MVLVEGDKTLPQEIKLYPGNSSIGRDPALATIVLSDRRVSRFHCRFSSDADGHFRIWNEGSGAGTYVNFEEVGMSGQLLEHNAIVNFGPIQYRFEMLDEAVGFAGAAEFDGSKTEPYSPAFGHDTTVKASPPACDNQQAYPGGDGYAEKVNPQPATDQDWTIDQDRTEPFINSLNKTEPKRNRDAR